MAADEKWYFTKEQLANTPSTKCGYNVDGELSSRQQAAHLIQDMGQRLQVTQLCINTAMVYMHRFYVFHSFSQFNLDSMAAAALFLAAKVEEQPRKLEHIIRVKQICQHRTQEALDTRSEQYLEQAQDLVFNENVLLQTLGFDVAIDHPHTHVVRCCHLVRASKDLAQTSYFMASNSLHLTTMCLQYKPTVVACFCIHLACKWSNWEIPQSNEGKYWFYYVDKTVTQDLLEQLTDEFLVIFEKCPSRLKKKIKSANQNTTYQFDKMIPGRDSVIEGVSFQSQHRPDPNKPSSSQASQSSAQRADSREYQEKRERPVAPQGSHSQHRDGHHRSHHAGHPHPSSSSALLKPHAGMPVHNKMPHPTQHRSSMPHHPRPDHHGRPEHPQRPDHQQRPDHPPRPDHQQRPDHPPRPDHPQRLDHQTRSDYQQRPDRQARPDHGVRPDHHSRSDHQVRPDQVRPDHHQVRPDHPNRPDHQQRAEHHARPDHQTRPDHQVRSDHQMRPDHSGNQVTAARDQLRREAAQQREASRREVSSIHHIQSSLMTHSPAQRTTSGDSAISSSSSTSLTPSSQDWSGFGVTTAAAGGPSPLPQKQPGPSDPSHRHSSGSHDKLKASNTNMDSYSRHKGSLSATDRRATNTPMSLDRKMMQEISERRQLESFFGKSEAVERINEKHQVKHMPFKDVKKESDTVQLQPQPSMVPSLHIKKEKVSPSRQLINAVPSGRMESDMTAPSMSMRQNSYKPSSSEYLLVKNIKTEPNAESLSGTRNGTTVPALLTPKVEKVETDIRTEGSSMTSRLPPVKSSIFSPEKTLPKERESPILQRPVKTNCPSPGIAFGSPPVTPGKSQSLSLLTRIGPAIENEPMMDVFKMEKDAGYDSQVRDSRVEMKNVHQNDNSSFVSSNRGMHAMSMPPSLAKVEPKPAHHLLNKTSTYPNNEIKAVLHPPLMPNLLQARSNAVVPDERQSSPAAVMPDVRSMVPVKMPDVRSAMPLVPVEADLGAVAFPASEVKDVASSTPSAEGADHHHHKAKKKKEKKEKHRHKDKDKEKHKEEKKHKNKHKEKDKERRKGEPDNMDPAQTPNLSRQPAITLKIPKANITPPPVPAVAAPSSGGSLKLKINLAQLSSASSSSSSSKESRKRERDRTSPGLDVLHSKAPKLSSDADTPKRGASIGNAPHSGSSKSNYARQNGLDSRGGGRHHMPQPQHYSGNKMVLDGSSMKPSEISKNSSSHSSTS
ncbi:cyclin-T [Thrips palmi]|uniref:Cyclin-T n=1 Tax=Thrips palmi TaxID=161013 RepID=A0A6P8Z8C4_THRPL|nr:cyclin-T [Thrips palmi]